MFNESTNSTLPIAPSLSGDRLITGILAVVLIVVVAGFFGLLLSRVPCRDRPAPRHRPAVRHRPIPINLAPVDIDEGSSEISLSFASTFIVGDTEKIRLDIPIPDVLPTHTPLQLTPKAQNASQVPDKSNRPY